MTGSSSAEVRVGCSGWCYRDWRGRVYPPQLPQRLWFEHYATLFDTVELNATFYRLPTVAAVEQWAEAAPSGFLYAAKLGSFGTHRKKLLDPETWLPNHVDRARRFGPTLGPTLVQLPPRWKRNTSRLDEFLEVAPSDMRWAVEFRDPSWLHDDVYDVLQRHGAALCIHDLLPKQIRLFTTEWTYARFHGPDASRRPYHGRYGHRRLARSAEWLADALEHGRDVFAYFNNDTDANAVADAVELRDLLADVTASPQVRLAG